MTLAEELIWPVLLFTNGLMALRALHERNMFVLFVTLLLGRVDAVNQLKGSFRDVRKVFRQFES